MNKLFKKLALLVLLGLGIALLSPHRSQLALTPLSRSAINPAGLTSLDTFKRAFDNQQSNIHVNQTGAISKVLRYDNHGLQHNALVRLNSGQQLMIAHNTDLAPKVEGLKVGEVISFNGEYEWNNKGGVVHWAHRDPKGSHPNGWLFYNNRKYELWRHFPDMENGFIAQLHCCNQAISY